MSLVASIKTNPRLADAYSRATMDSSPLTQQTRPGVFEPKVVALYKALFRVHDSFQCWSIQYADWGQDIEDDEKPEGFWRELFLLKPDLSRLRELLENSESAFLLHLQNQSQQLVRHAISHVKEMRGPADENALDVSAVSLLAVGMLLDL